ncbi:MAG: hypothetical protein ACLPXU_08555 [Acidimicrobiales bacterium]|jgi:hypothetical protein
MTTSKEITEFVTRHFDFPRASVSIFGEWEDPSQSGFYVSDPRSTAEQLGSQLAEMAEFKALRLAAILSTPDGQLIAEAVEAVSPPFFRSDVQLIVESLKYAADLQRQGKRRAAALALGIAALGAVSLFSALWSREA